MLLCVRKRIPAIFCDCKKMECPLVIIFNELNITCLAAITLQFARIFLFPKYAPCWELDPVSRLKTAKAPIHFIWWTQSLVVGVGLCGKFTQLLKSPIRSCSQKSVPYRLANHTSFSSFRNWRILRKRKRNEKQRVSTTQTRAKTKNRLNRGSWHPSMCLVF